MSRSGFISGWVLKEPTNSGNISREGLEKSELIAGKIALLIGRFQVLLCEGASAADRLLNRSQRIIVYGSLLLLMAVVSVFPLITLVSKNQAYTNYRLPRSIAVPPTMGSGAMIAPDTLIHSFTLKPYTYANKPY
ncbi:hypothetical protein [Algoriphagus resistens]|uniref:hypothetical protein n=1 Tax=Algoriphagus resistens TaxID=1750590 RepID=UPI000716879F|nr:hypothetical protein [Algoriphagus resistens]